MQHTITSDPYLSGDLIGFTTGLVITLLLLGLTIRAAKLPGTPIANISFALSALAWNVGGLAVTLMLVGGIDRGGQPVFIAWAVQFTGAAFWPVAMLAIWRPFAVLRWQRMVFRTLQVAAPLSGMLIVLLVWWQAFSRVTVVDPVVPKHFAASTRPSSAWPRCSP